MQALDNTIKDVLNEKLSDLEGHFKADVAFYYGSLDPGLVRPFRDFIEGLKDAGSNDRLVILLNTGGGSAEAAEKMVEIMRFHYSELDYVVPDFAMSAGTILCMSGDRIFMDYSSSLGPIDPQVFNGTEWVPALGYLDKVEELLAKAAAGTLSNAEFLILQNQDLALLSRYEQARDLTVTLLKRWLVEYKFRSWDTHGTNPDKLGQPVTDAEKEERAEEIAKALGNNKLWHSHGRLIGPSTLGSLLRLQIDDYSGDEELRGLVRGYNDLITQYIARNGFSSFMHHRLYF